MSSSGSGDTLLPRAVDGRANGAEIAVMGRGVTEPSVFAPLEEPNDPDRL